MQRVCCTILILFSFGVLLLGAANPVRIMTYNLENYGGDGYNQKSEVSRNPHYRTVISEINPDIIIAQEIYGAHDGDTRFMEDVLNYEGNIFAAAFIDQKTDNNSTDVWHDIGVFYKNQSFREVSKKEVEIAGGYIRDAIEVLLKYNETGDTIALYGLHLKAGRDETGERESEARKLRQYLNNLNPNTPFIVAGDFNVYTSSEGAWQRLTEEQQDNDGRLYDPINRIGAWNNNSNFADVHTQSTRYSSGGLDDRFDMILVSNGIKEHYKIEYIPGTYTAFGNDGDHFNDSVNWQTNSSVSSAVADALYEASDHLPVVANFDFTGVVAVENENMLPGEFKLNQNYPNPFNPETTIRYQISRPAQVSIQIFDVSGRLVKTLTNSSHVAGAYEVTWAGTNEFNQKMGNGIYFYTLSTPQGIKISKKMVLVK